MKTKKFKVTAKNDKDYIWTFTEHKNENDYGNGIYIGVETPSKDHYSIDCRYDPDYKYLLNWHVENLEELIEID